MAIPLTENEILASACLIVSKDVTQKQECGRQPRLTLRQSVQAHCRSKVRQFRGLNDDSAHGGVWMPTLLDPATGSLGSLQKEG